MFTKNEIESLLSKQVVSLLTVTPTLYDSVAISAKSIFEDTSGVLLETKPVWGIAPFAFIMEHLLAGKLSDLPDNYIDRVNKNYNKAISILEDHQVKQLNSSSSVGTIGGLY